MDGTDYMFIEELRQIKKLLNKNNELLEEILKGEQVRHETIKWDIVPLLQKIEMR